MRERGNGRKKDSIYKRCRGETRGRIAQGSERRDGEGINRVLERHTGNTLIFVINGKVLI